MAPLAAALLPVLVCVLAPGRLLCGVLGGVRRGFCHFAAAGPGRWDLSRAPRAAVHVNSVERWIRCPRLQPAKK